MALKQIFVICALTCGIALAAGSDTLDKLARAIAESKGRNVYEAFKAIPEHADSPEKQAKAFVVVSEYLGQFDKACVAENYYSPQHHVRQKYFSYAELAQTAIMRLGEPGIQGLFESLHSEERGVAHHAAFILCEIEYSAHQLKGKHFATTFRRFGKAERKTLEVFLEHHGDCLSVHLLTRFVRAQFPAAKEYIHRRLTHTKQLSERKDAAFWMGAYGYVPALGDLLNILRSHHDTHLKQLVAGELPNFVAYDRTTKALEEVLKVEKNADVRKSCELALKGIREKRQKQQNTRHGTANKTNPAYALNRAADLRRSVN